MIGPLAETESEVQMKSRLSFYVCLSLLVLCSEKGVSQCGPCLDSYAGKIVNYICQVGSCYDSTWVTQFNGCPGGQTAYEVWAINCCGIQIETYLPVGIC